MLYPHHTTPSSKNRNLIVFYSDNIKLLRNNNLCPHPRNKILTLFYSKNIWSCNNLISSNLHGEKSIGHYQIALKTSKGTAEPRKNKSSRLAESTQPNCRLAPMSLSPHACISNPRAAHLQDFHCICTAYFLAFAF